MKQTRMTIFFIENVFFIPGDEVQVEYNAGTDTTPLYESTTFLSSGFNGFRI